MNATTLSNNLVGPVLRAGELADLIIEAIRRDNPGKDVHVVDKRAYLRVQMERQCVIRRTTMEELVGRPFRIQEIEPVLGSFSGQIRVEQEEMSFYFETTR